MSNFRPKAIVFDLDGTLVDSRKQVIGAFEYALEPFGIVVTHELLEEIRARSGADLFTTYLTQEHALVAYSRLQEAAKELVSRVVVHEGIFDILRLIQSKGLPLGSWTGRDHASAIRILEHLNLAPFFNEVIAGCQVKRNKPHPEGLSLLLERMKHEPGEVLLVGDHQHDLEGANSAGCTFGLARWGGGQILLDGRLKPQYIISSTKELYAFAMKC